MRGLLFLMLMIFGFSSFSQKLDSIQKRKFLREISLLEKHIHYEKIIDTCDMYLLDEECGWFREELIVLKTQGIYAAGRAEYNPHMGLYSEHKRYVVKSIINEIDSVIKKEKENCGENSELYERMQYEYYSGLDTVLPEIKIRRNKYNKTKGFCAVSPQYFYGNNQWIGVEFVFGLLQRKNRMKYIESTPMYSFTYLSLGFKGTISNQKKGSGLNISLYSGSYKWINVRPINFTLHHDGENQSWGYSPEVGFQFWYLHLNAGYNLTFNKSMRSYEKLYFTAKFDIPFYRF